MKQAITTKFIGPTDFKGSRVKATCQARSITLSWDDALDSRGNHKAAAHTLQTAMGWPGVLVSGWDAQERGVHVMLHDKHSAPSDNGSSPYKYRSREIERVVSKTPADSFARLKIESDGANAQTRHLNITMEETCALIDMFNTIDKD